MFVQEGYSDNYADATACEVSSAEIGYIASEPGLMVTKHVAKSNARHVPLLIVNNTNKTIKLRSAVAKEVLVGEQCCVSVWQIANNQRFTRSLTLPRTCLVHQYLRIGFPG